MSKYTTELRFICENEYNGENSGFNDINTILTTVAPKIFNFDFPIFDEDYRIPLEVKILRTYYTREICEETVGLWKLRLQNKMCEIMPYYNQLYESAKINFEPLVDVDYSEDILSNNTNNSNKIIEFENLGGKETTDYTKSGTDINTLTYNGSTTTSKEFGGEEKNSTSYKGSETENISNSSNNTKELPTKITTSSDTPQGGLNGVISDNYLTKANKEIYTTTEDDNYTGTSKSEKNYNNRENITSTTFNDRIDTVTETFNNRSNINSIEYNTVDKYVNEKLSKNKTDENITNEQNNTQKISVKGKRNNQSFSQMLMEYRKTFINIDKMIIDDLSDLFFGLW